MKKQTKKQKMAKRIRLTNNVVAEGEATGHAHRLTGEDAMVWQRSAKDGTREIDAPNGATLSHEEHKPINLPAGEYACDIVREHDPITKRAVRVID